MKHLIWNLFSSSSSKTPSCIGERYESQLHAVKALFPTLKAPFPHMHAELVKADLLKVLTVTSGIQKPKHSRRHCRYMQSYYHCCAEAHTWQAEQERELMPCNVLADDLAVVQNACSDLSKSVHTERAMPVSHFCYCCPRVHASAQLSIVQHCLMLCQDPEAKGAYRIHVTD